MQWLKNELESVPCDLCGSTDSKPVTVRPDGLSVVECTRCALCYLNPRPTPQRVAKLYEADYFQKSGQKSDVGYAGYLDEDARRGQRLEAVSRLATMKKHLPSKGKRCLEVGCATGEFSSLLHRNGFQVTGIDISAEAIRHAKSRFPDIDFLCGDIASVEPGTGFDFVCAFEVIEHVLSPRQFLAKAADVMKPRGFLVLTTPNYGCARRHGPDRWVGFQTSLEHLYFLSAGEIQAYAAVTGLELSACLTDRASGLATTASARDNGSHDQIREHRRIREMKCLQPLRRLKNYVACKRGTVYIQGGEGHNLMTILRKTGIQKSP